MCTLETLARENKEGSDVAIRLEFSPGRVTAFLEGEIDHHNAAALRTCIDEAVEQHRPELLRMDFGGVSFMDSSGVGLVMGRAGVMRVLGGRVEAVNLTPQAFKVMQLANLDQLAVIRQKTGQKAPQRKEGQYESE